MSLDQIIKEHAKILTESLRDLYIQAYIKGAKSVATKEFKESIYDEAVNYYNEQGDWIESNFVNTDSQVLFGKLDTAITEGQSFGQFWKSTKDSGMFSYARAERIFRTETNRAFSEGTIRQYLKEGVKKVNILLGPNPCPICIDIATSGPYPTKDVEGMFPIHPNSVINGTAPIYTINGVKFIRNAKVGDEVLTIDGTFKKVTAVSQIPAPTNQSVTITFTDEVNRKLSLTPKHRVWTKRGWVEARNLTMNDFVMQYYKPCKVCKELHPVWNNHCSKKCQQALRLTGKQINGNFSSCERKIDNVMMNHQGDFVSKWIPIISVSHNKVPTVKMLYDMTVEDNETFVVDSIVVHNCSCVLVNAAVSTPGGR